VGLEIVFMGSPEFATPALKALHENFNLVGVVTQPDRPKGRGKKMVPTPVGEMAEAFGIPVHQNANAKSPECMEFIKGFQPRVIVVVAYGSLLPREMLSLPELGCVNLHASLLPRHRGAAPIPEAILQGDQVTGLTTMMMDEGMDTGDILLQESIPIQDDFTSADLQARMLEPGAMLMVKTLKELEKGNLSPVPQDHGKATYTRPLEKSDGLMDWTRDADYLDRLVRAMNPWPVAHTRLGKDTIRVWKAKPEPGEGEPGVIKSIDRDGALVGAGKDLLRLVEAQAPGKKRSPFSDFARGRRLIEGMAFGEVL
jgi:methionyl-tRNA formyltransferase